MLGRKVADALMGVSTSETEKGVAVVTVDFPPVNALPVRGWYDLADAIRVTGRDPACGASCSPPLDADSTRASTSRKCSATTATVP
ncbi:hypothetical protein GCM10017744_005290 [Streptomyces antimycoticus]